MVSNSDWKLWLVKTKSKAPRAIITFVSWTVGPIRSWSGTPLNDETYWRMGFHRSAVRMALCWLRTPKASGESPATADPARVAPVISTRTKR